MSEPTSTELTQAAREIEQFTKKLAALSMVAPYLVQLGSLDQAKREAEARVEAEKAKVADVQAELSAAGDKLAKAKAAISDHEADVAAKHAEADRQIAEKQAAADKVVQGAHQTASEVLGNADGRLEQKIAAHDALMVVKRKELVELQKQIEEARVEVEAEVSRLNKVKGEIAQLRAKL